MRRLCALVALAVIGACSSHPRPTQPEVDDGRKPFFWRIDGGDAAAPSYLLGTFHIGVDPNEVLTPGVWAALDQARSVVLEVNIATTDSLGLGMHKPGGSLRQQMTAEEWDELLELLGIEDESDARKLEQIKLWAVYTSVLGELAPQTESIDTELQRRAGDKPLVFLEQVGFQEKLFDKYIDAAMLLSLLRDKKGQKAKLASQSEAYRSGDVDRMYRESVAPESFEGTPDGFRAEILTDRNKRWMPALTRELEQGGAFIAVGASHLLGDDGLLDLLEKAGYTVTRAR